MSDLNAAGGLGAVLRELRPLLHLDCLTVTGETLGAAARRGARRGSIATSCARSASRIQKVGGLAALFGTLAPNGAILKRSAADPRAVRARGPRGGVHVARGPRERASTRRTSTSRRTTSWCSRTPGRRAATRCRRPGYLPIPAKLARAGVKDMVRISDARMSGTAYGTIVLHVSPEAAVGGPLALVQERRPDPAERRGAPARPARGRGGARAPARGVDGAGRAARARLRASSTWITCSRPSTAATSTSCARRDASQPAPLPRRPGGDGDACPHTSRACGAPFVRTRQLRCHVDLRARLAVRECSRAGPRRVRGRARISRARR